MKFAIPLLSVWCFALTLAVGTLTWRMSEMEKTKVRIGMLGFVCSHVAGGKEKPILYCTKLAVEPNVVKTIEAKR